MDPKAHTFNDLINRNRVVWNSLVSSLIHDLNTLPNVYPHIKKVQVSVGNDHPQYCVLGQCKRCGSDYNYVVSHPRDSDQRSVNASAWLAANNFDFITGKPLNKEQ
jgi:hypothetical protein